MNKYLGDAILKGNLTVQTDKPLDSRLIVLNSDNLYDIDPTYAYIGMPVVSIEDRTIYILIDKSKINLPDGWVSIQSLTKRTEVVVLDENLYESLLEKDPNTLYFIHETIEDWIFPITLAGEWTFPIELN